MKFFGRPKTDFHFACFARLRVAARGSELFFWPFRIQRVAGIIGFGFVLFDRSPQVCGAHAGALLDSVECATTEQEKETATQAAVERQEQYLKRARGRERTTWKGVRRYRVASKSTIVNLDNQAETTHVETFPHPLANALWPRRFLVGPS